MEDIVEQEGLYHVLTIYNIKVFNPSQMECYFAELGEFNLKNTNLDLNAKVAFISFCSQEVHDQVVTEWQTKHV